MVKNYMEVLVDEYLTDLLHTDPRYKDVCTCEKCLDDMRALALNHIPPFYVTCKKGEVYGQYLTREMQNKADILLEIVKAIEVISKNRHE